MTTTEGRLAARQCVQDRMSDLRMNLADLARRSGVDVKTIRSFLEGERWPQKKSRAAISDGLSWPSTFIDRIAEGTLDPDFALGHVLVDGKHGPIPSVADGIALRLNGIDRQIDALWGRVDELEQQLQQLGGDGHADDATGGPAPTSTTGSGSYLAAVASGDEANPEEAAEADRLAAEAKARQQAAIEEMERKKREREQDGGI